MTCGGLYEADFYYIINSLFPLNDWFFRKTGFRYSMRPKTPLPFPALWKKKTISFLLTPTMPVLPYWAKRKPDFIFMTATEIITIFPKKTWPFIKVWASMWKKNFVNRQKPPIVT